MLCIVPVLVSVLADWWDTFPTNIKRNKHVIITSKQRFDVIITCLLRDVFAGLSQKREGRQGDFDVSSDSQDSHRDDLWVSMLTIYINVNLLALGQLE